MCSYRLHIFFRPKNISFVRGVNNLIHLTLPFFLTLCVNSFIFCVLPFRFAHIWIACHFHLHFFSAFGVNGFVFLLNRALYCSVIVRLTADSCNWTVNYTTPHWNLNRSSQNERHSNSYTSNEAFAIASASPAKPSTSLRFLTKCISPLPDALIYFK